MKINLEFRLFEPVLVQLGQVRQEIDVDGFLQLIKKWVSKDGMLSLDIDILNGTAEVCQNIEGPYT